MGAPALAQKKDDKAEKAQLARTALRQLNELKIYYEAKARGKKRDFLSDAKVYGDQSHAGELLKTLKALGMAKGDDPNKMFLFVFKKDELTYYELFGGPDKSGKIRTQVLEALKLFNQLKAMEAQSPSQKMKQATAAPVQLTPQGEALKNAIISVRGAGREIRGAQERITRVREEARRLAAAQEEQARRVAAAQAGGRGAQAGAGTARQTTGTGAPGPLTGTVPTPNQAQPTYHVAQAIPPAVASAQATEFKALFNKMLDQLARDVRSSKFAAPNAKYKVEEDVGTEAKPKINVTNVPEKKTVDELLAYIAGLRQRVNSGQAYEFDTARRVANTVHYILLLRNELESHRSHNRYDQVKRELNEAVRDALIKEASNIEALRNAITSFKSIIAPDPAVVGPARTSAARWAFDDSFRQIAIQVSSGYLTPVAKLDATIAAAEKALSDSRVQGAERDMAAALIAYVRDNKDRRLANKDVIPDKARTADRIYGAVMGALALAEADAFLGIASLQREGFGAPDRAELSAAVAEARTIFRLWFSRPAGDSPLPGEWPANAILDALNKAYPSMKVAIDNAFLDQLWTRKDNPQAGDYFAQVFLLQQTVMTLLKKMKDENKATPWEWRVSRPTGRLGPTSLVTEMVTLGRPDTPFAKPGTQTSALDLLDVKGGLLNSEMAGFWTAKLRRAGRYGIAFPTTIQEGNGQKDILLRASGQRDAMAQGYGAIPIGTQGSPAGLAGQYAAQLEKGNKGYVQLAEDYITAFNQKKAKMDADGTNAKILAAIAAGDAETKFAYERGFALLNKAKAYLAVMKNNPRADIVGSTVRGMPINQHRVVELIDGAISDLDNARKAAERATTQPAPQPRQLPADAVFRFQGVRAIPSFRSGYVDIVGDYLSVVTPDGKILGRVEEFGLDTNKFSYRAVIMVRMGERTLIRDPDPKKLSDPNAYVGVIDHAAGAAYKLVEGSTKNIEIFDGKPVKLFDLDKEMLKRGLLVPVLDDAYAKIENKVATPVYSTPELSNVVKLGAGHEARNIGAAIYVSTKHFKVPGRRP